MKKVLFLDIDGVLNSEEFFIKRDRTQLKVYKHLYYDLDLTKVAILNEIISKTNCTIVLSSSWRLFGLEDVNKALAQAGLTQIIKYRTTTEYMNRGQQIKLFVNEFEVEDYIVLDDEGFDITEHIPEMQFVETEWKIGLTEDDKDYIIKYFNRKEQEWNSKEEKNYLEH